MAPSPLLDCLIIGAGPAGLTAAIYLARFHLSIGIVDAGQSRAAMIPKTRNHAGFPKGISGNALLRRMRDQSLNFGAAVTTGKIETLQLAEGLFEASGQDLNLRARSVLLATGVVNNRPTIAPRIHDAAVRRGLLRYCPICDGYEVTDRSVAVIGTQTHGFNEALFLRMYTRDVTLIAPDGDHVLSPAEKRKLAEVGVRVLAGPCAPLRMAGDRIVISTPESELGFETVYPALGSVIQSGLAGQVGARLTPEGCLIVDAHQRTSIAGLYGAGDVAKGLDQISHAMGEAGVAATTIRNDLANLGPLLR